MNNDAATLGWQNWVGQHFQVQKSEFPLCSLDPDSSKSFRLWNGARCTERQRSNLSSAFISFTLCSEQNVKKSKYITRHRSHNASASPFSSRPMTLRARVGRFVRVWPKITCA
jgi:hypothetical protein